MKLSVALATYNGEKYIVELLQSLKNQTRKIDEVVITDDCSTDGTVDLIKGFIKANALKGWHVSVNEKNLGYGENFKSAIEKTTGDIVFPCDQDDIWVENRAQKMSLVLENNPQIGVLCTDYAEFYSGKEDELINYYKTIKDVVKKVDINYYNRFLRFPGCVMAIRKEFFDSVKNNWYKGWAQDEFIWCVSVALGKCYYYRFCSLKRRFHEGQVSIKKSDGKEERLKYLKKEIICSEFMLSFIKENGLPKKPFVIYRNCLKAFKNRLALVEKRKILKAFPLLFKLKCYKYKKSYLKELKLAIKG